MTNQFHILNGDALKLQFPKSIDGKLIIARECLVDGDVQGDTLEALFKSRSTYLAKAYDKGNEENYYKKVVPEFKKILAIPKDSKVFLWFEDDLFCQVNLWFVSTLLKDSTSNIYLVRPLVGYEYGFGGMSQQQLVTAFKNKIFLSSSDLNALAQLWKLYQKNHFQEMIRLGESLKEEFPFIPPAIQANIERFPKDNSNRPSRAIQKIMDEFQTKEFPIIFREFTKKEAIYGFGDLQVKRIYDQVLKNM